MRALLVVSVEIALLLTTGCGSRANPRLREMVRGDGDAAVRTTFDYDDDGRLSSVERGSASGVVITSLTWEGATLASFAVTSDLGGGPQLSSSAAFSYEGGRLVSAAGNDGDVDVTAAVAYDDQGRLGTITVEQSVAATSSVTTQAYAYGDGGALATITRSAAVTSGGSEQTTTSTTVIDAEAGKPVRVLLDDDAGDASALTAAYDGDRLAELVVVRDDLADAAVLAFEYDDAGRIAAVQPQGENTASLSAVLSYEDGDASDLDVSSHELFGFPLWDGQGKPHATLDARTQLPRLLGLQW